MSMPMSVSLRIGAHLMKQKLRGNPASVLK